jgi:regulator of protease activity HflC (stomatin/prohibitin superfamily)
MVEPGPLSFRNLPKLSGFRKGVASRFLWVLGGAILSGIFLCAIVIIPAGYVGVYDLFGKVADTELGAGIHLVNPLAKIHKFSVRTQEIKEAVDVPSREGLTVKVDVSLLLALHPERAADLYRKIGYEYLNIVVTPQLRGVVRDITSGYDAKALYTAERESISRGIENALRPLLQERGIRLEKILLRKITLPPKLAAAIENKLEAEQQAEQMKFVLDKEKQEAERKRIEAQGVADYQTIINKGLNENLLKWKGIEATREVAKSPNTKVVIVGSGKDGLPIILGNQ